MEELKIKCHAKINLGLHILDKRPDGYHNIETTFKMIGLHDELTLKRNNSADIKIISAAKNIPLDDNNICVKAIRLIQRESGCADGVDIFITKHIPVGAGLGGGSSDGAGVLVAYNRLLQTGLSENRLMKLAAQLGSDVPFFTGFLLGYGNTAYGQGRGEILEYFQWPLEEKVLIVYPNIEISTAWAYQNFRKHEFSYKNDIKSLNLTKNEKNIIYKATIKRPMFFDNMFETLVFSEYEEIKSLYEYLNSFSPILVHMSGSGSTVFAVFPKDTVLKEELVALKDYYVAVTRFE